MLGGAHDYYLGILVDISDTTASGRRYITSQEEGLGVFHVNVEAPLPLRRLHPPATEPIPVVSLWFLLRQVIGDTPIAEVTYEVLGQQVSPRQGISPDSATVQAGAMHRFCTARFMACRMANNWADFVPQWQGPGSLRGKKG
jgi:hypothetical protein